MTDQCPFCASERTVPVIYERMDKANYIAGNKYRLRCRECDKWIYCTSEETWRTHNDPQVLPAGIDPKDPEFVPAVETEYSDRLADESEDPTTDENRFECPNGDCTASHVGYPEECNECGVPYTW